MRGIVFPVLLIFLFSFNAFCPVNASLNVDETIIVQNLDYKAYHGHLSYGDKLHYDFTVTGSGGSGVYDIDFIIEDEDTYNWDYYYALPPSDPERHVICRDRSSYSGVFEAPKDGEWYAIFDNTDSLITDMTVTVHLEVEEAGFPIAAVIVGFTILGVIITLIILAYRKPKEKKIIIKKVVEKPPQKGFCPYCGNPVSLGAKYCIKCGSSLE